MSVFNEYICTPFLVCHCGGLLKVVLVRWNEPFQKLATCDMEGGIFVWIQYEGRWSVELVNDRGAQVPIQLLLPLTRTGEGSANSQQQ